MLNGLQTIQKLSPHIKNGDSVKKCLHITCPFINLEKDFFFFFLFLQLRFGKVDKYISKTNVYHHLGKVHFIADNHKLQEIDISTLEILGNGDLSRDWYKAFTSHPKVH